MPPRPRAPTRPLHSHCLAWMRACVQSSLAGLTLWQRTHTRGMRPGSLGATPHPQVISRHALPCTMVQVISRYHPSFGMYLLLNAVCRIICHFAFDITFVLFLVCNTQVIGANSLCLDENGTLPFYKLPVCVQQGRLPPFSWRSTPQGDGDLFPRYRLGSIVLRGHEINSFGCRNLRLVVQTSRGVGGDLSDIRLFVKTK